MRILQYINFGGVLALAVLCLFQWRINRELNLRTNQIEKNRIEQTARIEEQEKQLKGQAADLDSFRAHVQNASATIKAAESNLFVSQQQSVQLGAERDQLKESIAGWSRAVSDRDEQLTQTSEQIQKLVSERDTIVARFNELAGKHNSVVNDLNDRTREFNSLVERYNSQAKSAAQGNN